MKLKKSFLLFSLFISFCAFSQIGNPTGTWRVVDVFSKDENSLLSSLKVHNIIQNQLREGERKIYIIVDKDLKMVENRELVNSQKINQVTFDNKNDEFNLILDDKKATLNIDKKNKERAILFIDNTYFLLYRENLHVR